MRTHEQKSPLNPLYRDKWRLFESVGEFLEMPHVFAHMRRDEIEREKLRSGDDSLVAASDALLREFENAATEFATPTRPIIPAVVGGAWNIPAVFAGHPMAARTRGKSKANSAPLTILVDCGVSSGISENQMAARGACILALVRILTRVRPVTLWIGETNPDQNARGYRPTLWDFMKLDTQPLDLARAAYMLCDANFTRRVLWGILPGGPGWPAVVGRQIKSAEMVKSAAWLGQTLCIEAAHMQDEFVRNEPITWLKTKLAQLQEVHK